MTANMEIPFESLNTADLIVDAIYKGGDNPQGGYANDPLHVLFPKCQINGGFRKIKRRNSGKPAYVVLYTSMDKLEWPDYLDVESGIFRYYGDNKKPGRGLTETQHLGNKLLEEVFGLLNGGDRRDIPPFFVFKKVGVGRDAQFLGLAAPGNPKISPDKDLVAFWRTMGDRRFQNYEAYFTVLDSTNAPISRRWLEALIDDYDNSMNYAPEAWRRFIKEGRNGIQPLVAPRILEVPSKYMQLQSDDQGKRCLEAIRARYMDNPSGFEACATGIVEAMDAHFTGFSLTRPWRDGGRDAIGYYSISTGGLANPPLKIDCALEAKCYSESNSVGVREMSRLISRIRYRQFGIMVTTSYVNRQAYQEVVDDGHPILVVTASDIAGILRHNAVTTRNITDWLSAVETKHKYA